MNRIQFIHCQVLLILFYCSSLYAQPYQENGPFTHLSVKHGLSQNGVMSIFKDSKGFIWFGTRDGLNRYDGYQFKVFRHDSQEPTGLSNNFIRAITEDPDGTLWIATDDGLNSYNRESEKFNTYKNIPSDNNSLSNNKVISLLCSPSGDLWIGTENGLNLKRKDSESFKRYNHTPNSSNTLSDDYISALHLDTQNHLWVGTKTGGLNKLDLKSNHIKQFSHDPSKNNTISSNSIGVITENKDGTIWIGTEDNGITVLKNDTIIKHLKQDDDSLSNNIIRELKFDKKGNLWIATYDGLNYYHLENEKFSIYKNIPGDPHSLSHNSIRSLYLDDNGYLWAGTYFGGVNILNQDFYNFSHFQNNPINTKSLGYNIVGGMAEDKDGNLWIGTEGGGLFHFNYNDQSFTPIKAFKGTLLNTTTIKALLVDSNQNLWIGTHLNGLLKINLESGMVNKFKHSKDNDTSIWDNSIASLLEDHLGRIWIGTLSGLNLYEPDGNTLSRMKLRTNIASYDNAITTLFQDSKYNLWVGTRSNGLLKYSKDSIKYYLHTADDKSSISHNSIYTITEDVENNIWIGTYGGGINLLDKKNESFKKYGTKDGLVNDIVYEIEEDEHHRLWISTPTGMSMFDRKTTSFKNFTPSKGLPIIEFNQGSMLKHSKGQMFVGGFNGLLAFYPSRIKENPMEPEVFLEQLRLFNQPVIPGEDNKILNKPLNETKVIEYAYSDNVFTIEFIAFQYPQMGENQYAFKLEGFENNWNYVGSKRTATYTNLDPGTYIFKVKVANSDGIWSKNIKSIKIIKHPPYWKTVWAYLLYSILAFIVFMVIRKYFLIKLNLENNLELEKLKKRQLEKLTKLKLSFFTNISHDFRTPLTLIHSPLQELIRNSEDSTTHGQLQLIKKNVNYMLRLIDQLMDFRKMESKKVPLRLIDEPLIPFIKEIIYSFQELAKAQNIKYSFTSRFPNKKVLFDRNKLEKIIYNLLSNAFKYTPEGGEIKVEVYTSHISDTKNGKYACNDYVEIVVYNSGNGIEKKNLKKIFDRFYQGDNHDHFAQPGSGIGLSLVKGLVKIHKGYIKANSEVNKYTELVVGIPLENVYQNVDAIQSTHLKNESNKNDLSLPTVAKIKDKKHDHSILIVEDHYDLRSFLEQSFSSNYEVRTAKNGEEALAILNEMSPSIILSDIMMPIMSGLELCRSVKTNPKTQHIPVLLLTARSSRAIELDGYDSGADDFISKPFNMDILKLKVKNLIASKKRIQLQSRKEVLLGEAHINNNSADDEFLKKLSDYIRDNISNPELNVNKTGEDMGISRVHLYRKVKAITGKTPIQFLRDYRLSIAAELLEQNKYNVNEICYNVGFQDVSYFRKCFKKKYGISATDYIERTKKVVLSGNSEV